MNRTIVCALAAMLTAAWPLAAHSESQVSDDYANAQGDLCGGNKGQASIDACTWAIESGLWEGSLISFAYYNRGNTYGDMGQYDRAIPDYDRAIELDSNYAHAISNRGNAYYHLGQYARAIQDYDRAIALDPNDALSLRNRGEAKYKLGDFDGADDDDYSADDIERGNKLPEPGGGGAKQKPYDPGN